MFGGQRWRTRLQIWVQIPEDEKRLAWKGALDQTGYQKSIMPSQRKHNHPVNPQKTMYDWLSGSIIPQHHGGDHPEKTIRSYINTTTVRGRIEWSPKLVLNANLQKADWPNQLDKS